MWMELIQPFLSAADAVLSDALAGPVSVSEITMEEEAYRRRALAVMIEISGDIEGRVIFDVEEPVAAHFAAGLTGESEPPADPELLREATAELANLVIGNAVTALNDQGFRFKVHPPVHHSAEEGFRGSEDAEALVMDFSSATGSVHMNVVMRYNRRRRADATL
ncbi:MAG: chemotaxis protein CheX [Acidobacteriota bacterium]|nr:chemotaxis protein CheX [Acidobacteriota bacterium]